MWVFVVLVLQEVLCLDGCLLRRECLSIVLLLVLLDRLMVLVLLVVGLFYYLQELIVPFATTL